LFFFFIAGIYGITKLDFYLKKRAYDLDKSGKENYVLPKESDSNYLMIPLICVLTIIMIWCFYIRFVISHMRRKKLLWVEVKDQYNSYFISRNEAKRNLHIVSEMTTKLRGYNSLFDKYWYR
jgi:hypothetical protein